MDSRPHECLEALRDHMLPSVQRGKAKILVAQPPLQAPEGIEIVPHRTPALGTTRIRHTNLYLAYWPRESLVAMRYIKLLFVVEGEVDFRIGVTRRMAETNPALDPAFGYYILKLPAGSLVLVPPGVPYSDGTHPYWERPHPERARSRVLSIYIFPHGPDACMFVTKGSSIFMASACSSTITVSMRSAICCSKNMACRRHVPPRAVITCSSPSYGASCLDSPEYKPGTAKCRARR